MTKVVVVGRDATLWLTASVLQTALAASGVEVTAVELPTRLSEIDLHAAQPPLEALHSLLGLDEAQLLRATRGCFSLGQNFRVDGAAAFFHAFGAYGAPIDHKDFFPFWLKARGLGLQVALEDFSLTAAAAKHGRMLLPDEATETYGRTDYGYHLPALAYAGRLKALAVRRGVALHQAEAFAPVFDPQSGDLRAVETGDGRRIEGRFFVDATGPDAELLHGALGVDREAWRAYFPGDRTLTAAAPRLSALPPYAEIRAGELGWTALHPSQAATQVVQAYAGDLCGDEAALHAAARISGLALQDAVVAVRDPGRRRAAWERNCVAVGEAACVFDPIHGVELQALQLGIVHLLGLFPRDGDSAPERAEYNATMRSAFERIRDFQSAHYVLNRYGAAGFWARAREGQVSPELIHKLETFRSRGVVPLLEDETFLPESWQALFVGHGLAAESYNPIIERTSPDVVKGEFRRLLGFVKDQVLRQPLHDAYLGTFSQRGADRA